MANAGEAVPRGDGLAFAQLLAEEVTNESLDQDWEHLLQQFRRHEGTPRKNNRSSTAHPQVHRPQTASASDAANNRPGIQCLAETTSAWSIVQAAAATGAATDFMWEPDAGAIETTVWSVAAMLQRTANEAAGQ